MSAGKSAQSGRRTNPKRAVLASENNTDIIARETVGFGKPRKYAVREAHQSSAIGSNPEDAGFVRAESLYRKIFELIRVKQCKLHAVKSSEAVAGSDPKV